jgi:hypothetical protein
VIEDRRELLELLAYGRDPEIRPADRLRAVELLREIDGGEDVETTIVRELAHLPDEALAEMTDLAQADVVRRIIDGDVETMTLYPVTTAVLRGAWASMPTSRRSPDSRPGAEPSASRSARGVATVQDRGLAHRHGDWAARGGPQPAICCPYRARAEPSLAARHG